MKKKLVAIATTVAALGSNRVNPSVSLSNTSQATSNSPAMIRNDQGVIEPEAARSCSLGLEQTLSYERLRDLHRIERRSLAEVVGDTPEGDSALHGRISTNAADKDRVLPDAFSR